MLFISRKLNESVIINNNIELKVLEIKGKTVKLGFEFPKEATVLRKELHDKIMAENIAASKGDTGDLSDLDDLGDDFGNF